jgi:hypothetical protein
MTSGTGCARRAAPLFPRQPVQGEYNERLRQRAPLIEAALRRLAGRTPRRRSSCG